MKIIVIGGAGDMGSRAVRCLAEFNEVECITIADRDCARSSRLAYELWCSKVDTVEVDADNFSRLVDNMKGYDVAASALGPFYKYEAKVAQAAVEAGVDYVSICDDYDAAQAVFALDAEARAKGVTVLTGLGWTPGLSNVLARKGAAALDHTREINVAWAGSAYDSTGLAVIYHTIHIFTGNVPSYQGGRAVEVLAGSGREKIFFPEPVGDVTVFHLGHPEPVTLPRAIDGIESVTLKGGLTESALNRLARGLARAKLSTSEARRKFVVRAFKAAEPVLNVARPRVRPCSALRVDIKGERKGSRVKITYGAVGHMDQITGVPLAVGAVMLGRGEIRSPGVSAPETCVEHDPFLREVMNQGIRLCQGDALDRPITLPKRRGRARHTGPSRSGKD